MKEFIEMLEVPDEDDVDEELDAIYIQPPNSGSHEESGDESVGTVNYLSGRHLQASSIRFGYKVWALNSTDGYLIDFDVHQGGSIARENSL